jgi:hypothetical protein
MLTVLRFEIHHKLLPGRQLIDDGPDFWSQQARRERPCPAAHFTHGHRAGSSTPGPSQKHVFRNFVAKQDEQNT